MINVWQNKRHFTSNDLVESIVYSSIVYGGLNDIDALKALYEWLFGERQIHQIQMPIEATDLNGNTKSLPLILLSIKDDNYGCNSSRSSTTSYSSDNNIEEGLRRYVEFIPDDMTLCFLYAIKDKKLSQNNIKPFETIVRSISKKLKLQNKDSHKPHLSQVIKYANYYWRQIEGSEIDNALAMVKQGKIKTTGLSTDKVLTYNKEVISTNPEPLLWSDLFNTTYFTASKDKSNSREYPIFSKNLIKAIQDNLKITRIEAIGQIKTLQQESEQPNAKRLLGWVLSLLEDSKNRFSTISKYCGCIGRDWLMLTMDEELDEWEGGVFQGSCHHKPN
jgi:hypothetical protein